ncbi:RDD family protein [Rubrivirga marina]|uniref:RDD domain-containing protein n=1 Tax=Rubrivirga marina TaxID=1196024 RepID=A0A271J3A0_9BACT|nr:RDD family protein [Rubrivirga marina]PAP77767.1 hypothetical protein BSZ37_15590 [Rubrivirga marina]
MDLSLDIRTAQNVPLALEPASLGQRILATLADGVIVIAWWILVPVVLAALGVDPGTAVIVVVYVLPPFLYHLAFEVLLEGRTPGKLLLKTQVARVDGAQPTLGQYLLRWLLRFIDVTASSGVVAVATVALTQKSQRLGDLAAGTTVVRRRRVRLEEVLYPRAPEGHVVEFPEAERLSDADVRTLRAVLVRLRLSSRDARAVALARRAKAAVERRLGLEPVRMPPEAFLKAVVRDHVFLLDRLAGGAVEAQEPDDDRVA